MRLGCALFELGDILGRTDVSASVPTLDKHLSVRLHLRALTPLAAHSDVFQAIANPGRRLILDRLRKGEQSVMTLAEPFDMSLAAVSQQLSVLRRAGLVHERRLGRQRLYRLNPAPLREVRDWVRDYERFWTRKLRNLARFLDKQED